MEQVADKYKVKISGKRTAATAIIMVPVLILSVAGIMLGVMLCLTIIGAVLGIPIIVGAAGLPAMVFAWYYSPIAAAKNARKRDAELAQIKIAGRYGDNERV